MNAIIDIALCVGGTAIVLASGVWGAFKTIGVIGGLGEHARQTAAAPLPSDDPTPDEVEVIETDAPAEPIDCLPGCPCAVRAASMLADANTELTDEQAARIWGKVQAGIDADRAASKSLYLCPACGGLDFDAEGNPEVCPGPAREEPTW